MENVRRAEFWETLENMSVRCGLCPHRCIINIDSVGLCGVRENHGGELVASCYGVVSSIALDPIEKKPLYMFHPRKQILSVGGFGCNLNCPFCQNHEISVVDEGNSEFGIRNSELAVKKRWLAARGRCFLPEDIAELAVKTVKDGNIGVAYTYNEPLIGYEFLRDCAESVHSAGLKNILVTNGCINEEPLETLLPYVDAMNIDLKGFTDAFYKRLGGDLETVKKTIDKSREHCHVEVTTLVVPGENEKDIEDIARWLSSLSPEIPLHLSRFFPRFMFSEKEPTPRETIIKLRDVAKEYLNNVYAGNM